MIRRPALLMLSISCLLISSCDSHPSGSDSKLGRAFAALSGDTRTETTLFFTQNINLLQQLHSANADMRWQLKNIWKGKKSGSRQLQSTLDASDKALENLDANTRLCGNSPDTSPYRESIVLLDRTWKQQLINAHRSLNNSQQLRKVRTLLQALLKQSNQFTKTIIESTAKMAELKANKESSTVSHYLTFILSKSTELAQRIQYLLSNNVMNEEQLKKIMRSRTIINRILRGMFRGDSRTDIKIVLNPKRRKIISTLQKQFEQHNYLALATAYEKLLEKQITESNTTVDFEQTQKLINQTVNIAHTLIEKGHRCG